MSERFTIGDRALQEVYGGCIPAILDGGIPCTQSQVLKLLNELNRLAEANEEQCLVIMTYLHDNYYDIWEEVNKEVFKE